MENAYGIGVKNRYDLFYNDELDPFEILKQQEEERERRKTEKIQTKDKCKSVKPQRDRTGVASNTPQQKKLKDSPPAPCPKPSEISESAAKLRNKPPIERPPKSTEDEFDVKDDKSLKNTEERNRTAEQRERSSEFRRGRGGFRSRGRGRGRGNFYGSEGRKQELDRHGGSDRVCSDQPAVTAVWEDLADDSEQTNIKKENVDNNWCDSAGFKSEHVQEFTVPPGSESEGVESKENVPVVLQEMVSESVREMTLDEWKREQESKRAVPKFNLRKPGEGEDNSQWKKLYVLRKKKVKEEDDDDEDEDDEEDGEDEFNRRGRHRQLVDIQINFNYSRRGRGRGRGSRGTGPRSGGAQQEDYRSRDMGPAGSSRMNRGQSKLSKTPAQSAPRVDDWNDFPSLITA